MANDSIVITKIRQPRAGAKTRSAKRPRCNYFTATSNPEEVILRFGVEQEGTRQVQILHNVVLSMSTARRIKDAMATLLRKQDAPQVRVITSTSPKKLS